MSSSSIKVALFPTVSLGLFILALAAPMVVAEPLNKAHGNVLADIDERAESDLAPRWLGPDGTILPFATERSLLEFLRTADVVATKELSDGINKPLKVRLRKDGIEANAIFRTVNVDRVLYGRSAGHDRLFRDSYRFEVAAYELARLLGIDNVPPAVIRKLAGNEGSIQLWVEKAQSESSRLRKRAVPPDTAYWVRQRHVLRLFDNLIYNFDRNHGNLLLDASGKLWFVDHTRSFKRLPALVAPEQVRLCDRHLWQRLRALDPQEVHQRLRPYIEPIEIQALLERRDRIVERIDQLIAEHGPDAILFDV